MKISEHYQFIFLGGFYNPQLIKTIAEDTSGKVMFSNHNFELKIIDGLISNDIPLRIVTTPRCFSYPHNNKRAFIQKFKWNYRNIAESISVGFCNVFGINKYTIPHNTFRELRKIVEKSNADKIYIIENTPTLALLQAASKLRKLYKDRVKLCLIVPDIPQFISMLGNNTSIITYLIKRMDEKTVKMCENADCFVLLTEQMKELLPVGEKPFIVMEGLCNNKAQIQSSPSHNKAILYTGILANMYGISDMLKAFSEIDDEDAELWICGSGDAEEDIRQYAKKDKRITFYGLVNSEKAVELQQKAAILVNPRTNIGEYTKYSFPSKTMEYMLAGKPVVMHKLDGVPAEYDEYLFYAKDDSWQALRDSLEQVLSMTEEERKEAGLKAQQFVLQNKNVKIQAKRIIDLCLNLK